MVMLLYEGIFRRPVTEQVQIVLAYAGLAILLALMAFVDADGCQTDNRPVWLVDLSVIVTTFSNRPAAPRTKAISNLQLPALNGAS